MQSRDPTARRWGRSLAPRSAAPFSPTPSRWASRCATERRPAGSIREEKPAHYPRSAVSIRMERGGPGGGAGQMSGNEATHAVLSELQRLTIPQDRDPSDRVLVERFVVGRDQQAFG